MEDPYTFFSGVCKGCFIEIYGEAGTGKTLMLMSAAASASLSGARVLYIDSRLRFNPSFIIGLARGSPEALSRIDVLKLTEPVLAFEKVSKALLVGAYGLVLWDGLSVPFYEARFRHELSLISRLLSIYSLLKGSNVIASNGLIMVRKEPDGYRYTSPYVHYRFLMKRLGPKSFISGHGIKAEYIITRSGVLIKRAK